MKYLMTARLLAAGTIGLGALAVAGLGVGVAVAAGHSGTIHGCVAKSDGTLHIVNGAGDCSSHETALSFNAKGARGPRGRPGAPGTAAQSGTFQMYADVDQNGDLGSNYGAVSASDANPGSASGNSYTVVFNHPIGSCAAVVQPGYAGGNLQASTLASVVTNDATNPRAFDVLFDNRGTQGEPGSAFMMTVTCHS